MLRDDTSGDADFKTLTIARFVRVFYGLKCSLKFPPLEGDEGGGCLILTLGIRE